MKNKDKFELNIDTPVELADMREGFRHNYGFTAGKIIFALCEHIAELRGWNLNLELPEVEKRQKQRNDAWAQEKRAKEQDEAEQRLKRYIKKHGRVPSATDKQDEKRKEILARMSAEDRQILGYT